MFKSLVATLLVFFSLSVVAQPLVIEPGKLPQAQLKEKCKESCIVLDKDDWAALVEQVQAFAMEAYKQGLLKGRGDI